MPRNKDDLPIGGFGQLAQNVDATGRRIKDNVPPPPRRKPEFMTREKFSKELNKFNLDLKGETEIQFSIKNPITAAHALLIARKTQKDTEVASEAMKHQSLIKSGIIIKN